MGKPLSCWRCPVCEEPLICDSQKWQCENQHSFDIAKEGYVNLLLPQHKNSKAPGDSKEMVLARRAFLSRDHYLPLAKHLSTELLQAFSEADGSLQSDGAQEHISIFDAGCGEGYYLNSIAYDILTNSHEHASKAYTFCGADIAKPAVQKAAKRVAKSTNPQTAQNPQSSKSAQGQFEFAVASSFNLPVISDSQDAVIQIFAPSKSDEICRILKLNGLWISVNPASEHLFELKNMVYDSPEKHSSEHEDIAGFALQSQQTLKFEVVLSEPQQRENLLMMTPFYWTISLEKKQKLLAELSSTHAHFDIKIFRKL